MMFSKQYAFSPLPSEEDGQLHVEGKETEPIQPRPHNKRKYVLVFAGLLSICLIAATGLSTLVGRRHSTPRLRSCGNTPEIARSRGCSFDLISFAWQTPECYDEDLVAEFASWSSWPFFADDKFTIPVSQSTALEGNHTLFVKWDYHMVHCTFMWRQMHRAYERGWIDAHLGNYNHTLHCQKMMLMDPAGNDKLITQARVIYPECQKVMH